MLQIVGGLVSLIDSIMIFSLNMTYDVPVKLFSFHLVLMSILILAPDIPRLLNVLVLNRPAPASTHPSLGRRRRVVQIGVAAQVLLGAFYVWSAYVGSIQRWTAFGEGAPRPPFYGIWVIDRMTIDGIERAPLVTDYGRWRRVVIQTANSVSFWRMDDTQFQLPAQVDASAKTMTITVTPAAATARKTIGRFALDQPGPGRLVFDGELNSQKIRLETHLFPREKFLLVSRGFNWIQEFPFNR